MSGTGLDGFTLISGLLGLLCIYLLVMCARASADAETTGGVGLLATGFFAILATMMVLSGMALYGALNISDLRQVLFWIFWAGVGATVIFAIAALRLWRIDVVLGLFGVFITGLSAIVWRELL